MSAGDLVRVPKDVGVLQLTTGLHLTWGCCEIWGLTQDEAQTVIDLLVDAEQKADRIAVLENKGANKLDMARGIVLAIAETLRLTTPEEIISAAGITDEELALCSDYDLAALREAGITNVESGK